MPYRDSARALTERYEALEKELRASRERTQSLEELRAQEARIALELAEIGRKLAELQSHRRQLPLLENVAIASPCTASWDRMQGDDRVRFCGECKKNVYNLSAMAGQDAEDLLRSRSDGDICVRLYKRADGTVLTQDCPVGVKRMRRRKLAWGVASATALTAAAVMSALRYGTTQRCTTMEHPVLMGAPVAMGSIAVPQAEPPVVPPQPPPTVAPPEGSGQHLMGGPMIAQPPPHAKMGRMKASPGSDK